MEQGNGQNMNLQSFWTGYFSGQCNGILADRFKESYQMLLGRVDWHFFSWKFEFEVCGTCSDGRELKEVSNKM